MSITAIQFTGTRQNVITQTEDETVSKPVFEVFPNPVAGSGAITIKVHKPGAARIETRDEQGRAIGKIFEGTIDAIPFVNDVTMDVGKGVYFITLELNGKTYRKKIVR